MVDEPPYGSPPTRLTFIASRSAGEEVARDHALLEAVDGRRGSPRRGRQASRSAPVHLPSAGASSRRRRRLDVLFPGQATGSMASGSATGRAQAAAGRWRYRHLGQHSPRGLVAGSRYAVEAGRQMQQRPCPAPRHAMPAAGRARSGSGNCPCFVVVFSSPPASTGKLLAEQPVVELRRRRIEQMTTFRGGNLFAGGKPDTSCAAIPCTIDATSASVRISPPRSLISASKAASRLFAPPLTIGAPAYSKQRRSPPGDLAGEGSGRGRHAAPRAPSTAPY